MWCQMKKQNKITGKELNQKEKINMPNRGFKVIVIKILNGLEKRVEDLSEILNEKTDLGKMKSRRTLSSPCAMYMTRNQPQRVIQGLAETNSSTKKRRSCI